MDTSIAELQKRLTELALSGQVKEVTPVVEPPVLDESRARDLLRGLVREEISAMKGLNETDVMLNFQKLGRFLESEAGKSAIRAFIEFK